MMDAAQRDRWQQRLYSRAFLIGPWLQRRAVRALARDGSPQAVQILADAAAETEDEDLSDRARGALDRLTDPRHVDIVCAVWAATRHEGLAKLLGDHGWVATGPEEVRVLSALKLGRSEVVTGAGPAVLEPLARACSDLDPVIAGRARQALRQLKQPEAQDALCRLVIEQDDHAARDAALAAGLAPRDYHQRALFYFLTEQWDEYEAFDFEHKLLRAAYEASGEDVRRRVAAAARQAGRVEWVDAASGGRRGRRLGDMTAGEWETALVLLTEGRRQDDLWRLAQAAPLAWGARILRQLRDLDWKPAAEGERDGFLDLLRYAEPCPTERPDLRSALRCRKTLHGHTAAVRWLALSPDGQLLASAGQGQVIRLWHLPDGKELRKLEGHTCSITALGMTPDGGILVSGDRDGNVRLWSVPDGKALDTLEGHQGAVQCLAVTPDGHRLISGSADHTVRLWSLPDGTAVQTFADHTDRVECLAVSPDGSLLASGGAYKDSRVRLWDLAEAAALEALAPHGSAVTCLAFSPDGQFLISASYDRTLRLWERPECRRFHVLEGHTGRITRLAQAPEAAVLASAGGSDLDVHDLDNTVRLWSLSDGRPLATLEGHTRSINALAAVDKAGVLASGGDAVLRLWGLADRQPTAALRGHTAVINCLAASPDGRLLISAGEDRTVRVWGLEPLVLAELPVAQTTLDDLAWTQEALADRDLPEAERRWLEFLLALMHWRRRFDISLGEEPKLVTVGEFDIEIAG